MDFFAHGFWSYIIFHRTKKPWLAVFFGLFPDIISFGPYFVYRIINGQYFSKPIIEQVPSWTFMLYNLGHSLVIVALVFWIIDILLKSIPVYLYAWPIEIILDVPTHTREFFPVPFLWPLSEWKFSGISWAGRDFMILNYVLIICCLAYIFWKKGYFAEKKIKKRIKRRK
ncbi:MAG: hypothetical protein AABX05_01875 [Nanoarchaeota archaeon]